jgi:hypothetical protein
MRMISANLTVAEPRGLVQLVGWVGVGTWGQSRVEACTILAPNQTKTLHWPLAYGLCYVLHSKG